jgi:hypothetical protein
MPYGFAFLSVLGFLLSGGLHLGDGHFDRFVALVEQRQDASRVAVNTGRSKLFQIVVIVDAELASFSPCRARLVALFSGSCFAWRVMTMSVTIVLSLMVLLLSFGQKLFNQRSIAAGLV